MLSPLALLWPLLLAGHDPAPALTCPGNADLLELLRRGWGPLVVSAWCVPARVPSPSLAVVAIEQGSDGIAARMRVALVDPSSGRPVAEFRTRFVSAPEEVRSVCTIRAADLDGDGTDELFVEKASAAADWKMLGVFRRKDDQLISLLWQGLQGRAFSARGGYECRASYKITPAAQDGTRALAFEVSGTPSPECLPHRYRLVRGELRDENGRPR